MTEPDVLARAASALRDAHTGEREGSGFTRARIMNSVHHERRGRTLRWAVLSPIASVLLVGSAWAQSAGKWPVVWKAVTSVFVAAPVPDRPPLPASQRLPERASAPHDVPPAPDRLHPIVDQASPDGGVRDVPASAERRAREPVRRRSRPPAPTSHRSIEPATRAPAPAAAPEPERDRELGSFRRAHDLHFKGRARDAIGAYAEYLREYPEGRFVPEARYAMALDQIELGDHAAAREALAPFAAGRYGTYRQQEARTLLRALDPKPKPAGH